MTEQSARTLLNIIQDHKDDYQALLERFVETKERADELYKYKAAIEKTEPDFVNNLEKTLRVPLPEIEEGKRIERCRELAAECERWCQEWKSEMTRLMSINVIALIPLGYYFRIGMPNDFSTVTRKDATIEIAHSLRVFADTLLRLGKMEGLLESDGNQDRELDRPEWESTILEAISTSKKALRSHEDVAKAAGYKYNANFKSHMSELGRWGKIEKRAGKYIVRMPAKSQGHGQDQSQGRGQD